MWKASNSNLTGARTKSSTTFVIFYHLHRAQLTDIPFFLACLKPTPSHPWKIFAHDSNIAKYGKDASSRSNLAEAQAVTTEYITYRNRCLSTFKGNGNSEYILKNIDQLPEKKHVLTSPSKTISTAF